MNQILETNLNDKKNKSYRKKTLFFLQLSFSLFFVIAISIFIFYNNFNLSRKENYSNQVLENYNIARLYANLNNNIDSASNEIGSNQIFNIIGIIEISKN